MPGIAVELVAHRRRPRCATGVDSRSTSTESRTSVHAPRRISTLTITDAIESAASQPNCRISSAATIVPTKPSRSPRMCRYAPRTFRLSSPLGCSTHAEIAFATRPSTATASISPLCTGSGVRSRLTRFPDDPHRDEQQRGAVQERGEDLEAQVAVRALVGFGALAEPRDEQRERERGDVGEHVAGVGQQRERVREVATHRLRDENDGRDGERDAQAAHRAAVPVRVAVPGMRVPVARASARASAMGWRCDRPCTCECGIRESSTRAAGTARPCRRDQFFAGTGSVGESRALQDRLDHARRDRAIPCPAMSSAVP